ncbi:MAG: hypothetical protein PF588_07265 [Candidatus Kapabacteria bacterium]|jgi:hypothetical protein|nr:hypothetical protein [Candidatus Kapabacteria bacterium]
MATKAHLEAREADCKSVEEYCALALEALQEPKDEDYAKSLADTAEGLCSLPADYVFVAEVHLKGLGDKEYAADMYEEAEDCCFEAMEFAVVGHSMALYSDDKEKATELLENAANDAKKINEFLTIAGYVQSDLGNEVLAKQLLEKVEGLCKEIKDYRNLAENLIKDDKDSAKLFFIKGDNLVDEIDVAVEYAEAVKALFDDKAWAAEVLEDVEDDAQFTKEFVKLANGFMLCCDDKEKAEEMMDQGKDFAMNGEENIDLAKAYWELFQNKDSAAESYEKGLNDINDKAQLLVFAKSIASEMGNIELAKKFYARAESKMKGAKDLAALAQAVIDDLDDKVYASEIYDRTVEGLDAPVELSVIAADIITNLADKVKAAAIYRKAVDNVAKFDAYIVLLTEVGLKLGDKDFARDILFLAEAKAVTTPEMLQVAEKTIEILEDTALAEKLFTKAEEIVTTLDEMKNANAAVKKHFPDNADWIKRVDEKLEKRVANQDQYDAYQKIEEKAVTLKEFMALTDDMMSTLKDPYYARKLLTSAEALLDSQALNTDNYFKLMTSVKTHLDDNEWIQNTSKKLIADRIDFFFDFCKLSKNLVNVFDLKDLAAESIVDLEKNYDSDANRTAYNYCDLAKVVNKIMGDNQNARRLLEKAGELESDYMCKAYMGALAHELGDEDMKSKYLKEASATCQTAEQYQAMANRLKTLKMGDDTIRVIYADGQSNLAGNEQKLLWAEGIISIFDDREWAAREYKVIEGLFNSYEEKDRYSTSKKQRLEQIYF